jgi:hypothetical protein
MKKVWPIPWATTGVAASKAAPISSGVKNLFMTFIPFDLSR